jgi:fatty acid amide hydrolase
MLGDGLPDGVCATADAVRGRRLGAHEAVAAAVGRAEAAGALNAVAVPLYERALRRARRLDRRAGEPLPLAGVPVSLKETIFVRGTPASAGVPALAGRPSARDGAIAAALSGAGAVPVAKGNVAQFLWFAETDNPVYGRTEHPLRPGRSPGGSSGGDAALVAAGVVPVAIGTDAGGSVRVPAHCCGVFGLMPTAGRLTAAGMRDRDLFAGQRIVRNQPGILARDAADIDVVLRVLAAAAPGPAAPAPPGPPAPAAGLRVGVFDGAPAAPAPSAAIARALGDAARRLEAAGAHVAPFAPPGFADARRVFEGVFGLDGGRTVRRLAAGGAIDGRVARSLAAEQAAAAGARELAAAAAAMRRRVGEAMDVAGLDALLCPVYAVPAVPHGASGGVIAGQAYASVFNLLGWPAGVAPAAPVRADEEGGAPGRAEAFRAVDRGSAGLPVAVQVAARPWREDIVLGLLAVLGEP